MKRRGLCEVARRWLALLAMAPAAVVAQRQAGTNGYPVLRAEEDTSRICGTPGAGLRRALKCVTLGPPGWYASYGGEARAQFERYRNLGWGAARQDPDGYFLQRYMLHEDLHLGSRARVFLQLKAGIESGRLGGPRRPDEDLLDAHQAFLEIHAAEPLTLRLGRQELAFGSGRLISVRDGPNVRQSFDAFRALGRLGDDAGISLFVARPAETGRGFFDDGVDGRRLLWGAYLTWQVRSDGVAGLDLYYVGHRLTEARFQSGAGAETRHSLGTRLAGHRDGLRYDLEGLFQLGSFAGIPIRAWLLALDTSYGRPSWPLGARGALGVSIGSGDEDAADRTLGTLHPLYARGAELAKPALMAPANLVAIRPGVSASPAGVLVRAEYAVYRRRSLADGVYDVTGALLLPSRGSSARAVGQEVSLTLGLDLGERATLLVSHTRFLAGRFLEDVTPGKDLGFSTVLVRYWF